MARRGLAALIAALAVAAAACPAALASSTTQLPFPGAAGIAVDGVHEHVFISGGAGTSSVVVLDFDGAIVTTITGQQGASGLVVDESSGTLYVALRDGTAISKIDTTTLTETSRFSVAPLSLPTHLALAGGKLWFAHSCGQSGRGAGSVNLDGTGVTDETTLPDYCPMFATSPGDSNLLASGDAGLSPTTLYLFDVSTSPPTLVDSVRGPGGAGNLRDLAFTPDALRVLMASGAPYMVQSFLASDLSLAATYPTGPYPKAVAVSSDGAYVAAGADASYATDVFVFPVGDTTAVRFWDFNSTSKELVAGGLAFSPDASRLFAVSTNDSTGKADFRVYTNPTVPLIATTTSLAASASIVTYGKSVTLSAHVNGATSGTMSLYKTPYGGSKTLVTTAAVNASGNASFVVKPTGKSTYTAEFAESDTHASSSSSGRTVSVRSRSTAVLSGFYGRSGKYKLYRLGRRPNVRGTVVPNHAGYGLKFVAQRYRSGAWRTAATGTFPIQANGSAYAVLKNTTLGRYRQRVLFAGDGDHLGSTSPWVYLKVTR
jgi:hypothetical protein